MNAAVPLRVTTDSLPAARKIYLSGELFPDIRVPVAHITVHQPPASPVTTVS